jgi:heterotetrameric sarcosine oxidase gamma subunit
VVEPVARSPIVQAPPVVVRDGWEVSDRRSTADLTLADCTATRKTLVRGVGALPVPLGRARRDTRNGPLVVGSGPGEWTVLGGDGRVEAEGDFVSVIDLTHGRALVRLTGARAGEVLAKLCAVDLCDRVTPDGAAFRSRVADLVTDVVRDDRDGTRSYLLHCERSSGQYLFDCLLDAGAEFGVEPTGALPV